MSLTVICPKHGEHDAAIVSTFPGHEGVWCQICWLDSLGPSMPYRKTLDEEHQTMAEANPGEGWETMPKNTPTE